MLLQKTRCSRESANTLRIRITSLCALLIVGAFAAKAGTAPFDLTGPRVEMRVTRSGKTLPISDVANLQAGDRLWIHPEFPESQSVHYLLVVAFLRGTTNPPPDDWFTRAESWSRKVREEGIVVTVPQGAQQALLFLAPETGGGFGTLRSAVQGRPGTFVRASQDLNQASLDRSRLDRYLDEVKRTSDWNPKELKGRSEELARTLHIKVDQQCFDRPLEQQEPCLTQGSDQLVLGDAHTQSMVAALTTGPSADLIGAVSSTPLAGAGTFSPYVGTVLDLARLMGNLHTAEYQYIPALARPDADELNLRLNTPPSFRNPKSVLVVGLPAVEAAQLPPLQAVDVNQVFCLNKTPLILPVGGAPLVFSTNIGHDFVLRVPDISGKTIDLPATADPARGGFVIDTRTASADAAVSQVKATLYGRWGFEAFEGPSFNIRDAHPARWTIPAGDQGALVVGRQDTLHLQSDCAVCVESIAVRDAQRRELGATWKIVKPDEIEVHVPLQDEKTGMMTVRVKQFGLKQPDELPLLAYSEAAHLDRFAFNAGDRQALLIGTRLDEVKALKVDGVEFVPGTLTREGQKDQLPLLASNTIPIGALKPDQAVVAHVALKDGRTLDLQSAVEPPRPEVTLIGKSIQPGPSPSAIRFASQDQLPQDSTLSFFLQTVKPKTFPRNEKVEVATEDEVFDVMLSISDGSLVLQDAQTVLATLDPAKSFGPSAFGALRFRPVSENGTKGDWQPLARLVRIPSLKEVRCPDSPDKPCTMDGANLFLIDSVASDAQFTHTMPVPLGFAGSTLTVPRPNGTLLYIKLRDDPSTVNRVALPVLPE
ncbi:MAG TPA: hypothetical protein VJR26_13585 [Candidatus Acidoferrales bacterium]|nr:hypothetical protein [Candidatus Acidoferrales bacterium]